MGNCLDSSAKVDTTLSSPTSVPSKVGSKVCIPARSNLIPSYSDKSCAASVVLTPRSEGEILSSLNMKSFSFNELKNATRNFRPHSFLGEGGFGCVFKGWVDEHSLTVTKPGTGERGSFHESLEVLLSEVDERRADEAEAAIEEGERFWGPLCVLCRV